MTCCEEETIELEPNRDELIVNEHKPKVRRIGNFITIDVGELSHPMINIHFIEFIMIETNEGFQCKQLRPNDKPQVSFLVELEETLINVYVYCSVHGLFDLDEITEKEVDE